MKILALTKYSQQGPSSRYRFYNYKGLFEKHGIQMTIKPLFSGVFFTSESKLHKIFAAVFSYIKRGFLLIHLLIFKNKYQLILIEYELFAFFPSIFEYLLNKRGIKYIVDYDDAIFHKYDEHRLLLVRLLLRKKIARVMQYAQAVIVGNSYLKSYAQDFNTNILILPTVVKLENYLQALSSSNQDSNNSEFVIGWIGSKSTSPYLKSIIPTLKKFVQNTNARCHFIGFDKTLLTQKEMEQCNIKVIRWNEHTEIQNIIKFDLGIMPLNNDNWSKGKCGFKLIQYMACKKPVIASAVGANKQIVKNATNGFLVETNEQWLQALMELYSKPSLRREISENNITEIKNYYNINGTCEKYINLIKNTL